MQAAATSLNKIERSLTWNRSLLPFHVI